MTEKKNVPNDSQDVIPDHRICGKLDMAYIHYRAKAKSRGEIPMEMKEWQESRRTKMNQD